MAAGINEFEYRALLYRVGKNLSRHDLEGLTFMCRDIIPVARMERVRSATDLWQALTEKGKLTKNDLSYISLLMSSIGRENLLSGFQAQGCLILATVKNFDYLFQESLLKVANNLSSTEVKELTYLFQENIRLNSDKVFSATQLFQVLLQRQIISPTNLEPLFDGLVDIRRSDLTNYISHYLPASNTSPSHGRLITLCHLLEC